MFLTGREAQRKRLLQEDYQVYITNYESVLLDHLYEDLEAKGFTWIILDESHKIKNPSAKTTKRIFRLSAAIGMHFILTGTPVTNKELDLRPQISFLDRGKAFSASFFRFRNEYFYREVAALGRKGSGNSIGILYAPDMP